MNTYAASPRDGSCINALMARRELWKKLCREMEKLTKMPPNDPWVGFLHMHETEASSHAILPEEIEEFVEVVENLYKGPHQNLMTDPDWKPFKTWMMGIAQYLQRLGIRYHDLHEGNVMMRGDQHVMIDLGYSKAPKQEIDTIARLIEAARMIEGLSYPVT
jgi:hypothetical protein